MTITIAAVAYVGIAAAFWLRLYGYIYREHRREFPTLTWDDGDRVFGVFWGGAVALGWPLSLPIIGLIWVVIHPLKSKLQSIESSAAEVTR